MFTGIVRDIGAVRALEPIGGDVRLVIAVKLLPLEHSAVGDSIAVNGVCLTVTSLQAGTFSADVSRETLNLTTLGTLRSGARVNLEPALRAGEPLGGHLMSGHVDGVASVTALHTEARSRRVTIRAPAELARYIARKGSIALNGVSLTVNEVSGGEFGVNLIPHTWHVTTLDEWVVGTRINLEVDQIARYVERLSLGQ